MENKSIFKLFCNSLVSRELHRSLRFYTNISSKRSVIFLEKSENFKIIEL
jgi:hypothetical protein